MEVELANQLTASFGDAFYVCDWSGSHFRVLDRAEYLQRINALPTARQPGTVSTAHGNAHQEAWRLVSLDKKSAAKAVLRGSFSLLPAFARRALYPTGLVLLRIAKKVLAGLRVLKQNVHKAAARAVRQRRRISVKDDSSHLFPFREGDVFLSVGNDWDYGFDEALFRARKSTGFTVVRMVYDMVPYLFPHYSVDGVPKRFVPHIIDASYGADLVLCISQNTERDFLSALETFGTPAPQTAVVRLGDNIAVENDVFIPDNTPVEIKRIASQPFILYVSTIERRKNHETLYRAYRQILSANPSAQLPHLVFVGTSGWRVSDFLNDLALDPVTKDFITWLPWVPDEDLDYLYDKALFCVYPSSYEGWGLPIGEALSRGKAVIASSAGSIPEVGGELVDYVNPWDTSAWAEAIVNMSSNDDYRLSREKMVRDSYVPHGWNESTQDIVDKIRELMTDGAKNREH